MEIDNLEQTLILSGNFYKKLLLIREKLQNIKKVSYAYKL